MSRFLPLLWPLLIAAACTVAAGQTSSQTSGMPSSQQVDRNGDRLPTEEQRVFSRKLLRGETTTPDSPHEPRLAEAQIREDFRRLQLLNNRVQASAVQGASPKSFTPLEAVIPCPRLVPPSPKRSGGLKKTRPASQQHAERHDYRVLNLYFFFGFPIDILYR